MGFQDVDESLEALRRMHRSVPRNRLIAHAFFLIKFIEQWGTGTLRMIEVCREVGLPEQSLPNSAAPSSPPFGSQN